VDRRTEQLGRNEALFREVNERIEEVSGAAGTGDRLDFLCECGRRSCLEAVRMLRSEYEAVRAAPDRFVVALGHEHPEIERLVVRSDYFHVVEKIGDAGSVAEALDSRS
jgi:hypothetical protein